MRKLILRTFLFTALIAPAAAINNPLQCQTNVAVTPTLRAEGFTELVGDITLICTGGIPTALGTPVPQAQISFFMNTAVTSRVYSSGFSEALVIVDDPGSGVPGTSQIQLACADPSGICAITGNGTGAGTYDGSAGHPNVFPGRVSGNTVTFNVPIDGPAVVRTLRFTNIRVNATVFGGGSQQGATPVIATISLGGVSMQISNATPTVGFVQNTLSFSARTPDNASASSGTSITQCSSPQRAAVLRFAEGAPTTAKTRTYAAFVDGDTSPAPAAQNVPGAVYVNESGFYGPFRRPL